jgi:hypothetical protein
MKTAAAMMWEGSGAALYRLLWRPATLVWLPTAAICAFIPMLFVVTLRSALELNFDDNAGAAIQAVTLVAMMGLLVGQIVRELQHCAWSWAVPSLRWRLAPGVLLIGVLMALFVREVWTLLAVPVEIWSRNPARDLFRFWRQFPPLSASVFALYFLTFTAALRITPRTIAGLVTGVFFAHELTQAAAAHAVSAILAAAVLSPVLLYQALSANAARRQPFIPTRSLSGPVRAVAKAPTPLRAGGGAQWKLPHLGAQPLDWLRAGAFENHGYRTSFVRVATLAIATTGIGYVALQTLLVAFFAFLGPTTTGLGIYGGASGQLLDAIMSLTIVSVIITVPLAVFLTGFASISLTRAPFYPLSREQRAGIEYWGSLAEATVLTGLMAALLAAFWTSVYNELWGYVGFRSAVWERLAGSSTAWVPALSRPLAFVFLTAPMVQLFRLRYLRAPSAWNRIVVFIAVVALTAALTLGGVIAMGWTNLLLPRYSLIIDVPPFAVLALLSQLLYRRRVERYFATADLA